MFGKIREIFTPDSGLTLDQVVADLSAQEVSKERFLNIPSVSGSVNLISGTIASLPIKLYKSEGGKVTPIEDYRVNLLNDTTGDTLDGFQFKQALVNDFLLYGEGYSYVNRRLSKVYGGCV
ncbi:phage portal protein [Clostridium puniceum]|uniref:phage portal protein n=1 Tax=Clostridium puniceum TaxID=29367 RepID=UPI001A9A4D1F|nr:phage portal protein [Clostridium puniceum]